MTGVRAQFQTIKWWFLVLGVCCPAGILCGLLRKDHLGGHPGTSHSPGAMPVRPFLRSSARGAATPAASSLWPLTVELRPGQACWVCEKAGNTRSSELVLWILEI